MKEEKAVVAASAGRPRRAGGHSVPPVAVWGAAQTIVQRGGVRGRSWLCTAMGWTFHPPIHRVCPESASSRRGHLLATRLRLGPNREFSLILAREEETTFSPQPYGICNL